MNKWSPTQSYTNIAEANRCYYLQTAALYDATETCVTSKAHQSMLEADIDRILELCGKRPGAIRALDACGGSGNISLKLLRRGIPTTLADITPELLEIFRKKCESYGFQAETTCKEIGAFLAEEGGSFDLIIFSSALHHLENIEQVLTLVFDRLAPGGVLFTVFDPTSRSQLRPLSRMVQRLEYYLFKVFHQSSDLPRAIGRRLRRMLAGASASNKGKVTLNSSTVGMLAEYHVEQGIDDLDLVERLRQVGFEVVLHDRYVDTRSAWAARLIRWLGDSTAFKLTLRKPAERGR
ncbi:MAG: class I SAM-dependent methyltransferase [Verrucomicrobiota bacterium]